MNRLSRRDLLIHGLGSFAALAAPTTRVDAQPSFRAYPFSLGVASGDPLPDGAVLWTRLAPEPFIGGGMAPEAVPVRWEIASDDDMRRVVAWGETVAMPELAHSVHVEVSGLEPAHDYWYRFQAGNELSPIGRMRTTPLPGEPVNRLRFAVAGCQHYAQGYYTAFRHLSEEPFDFVFHYGDYIYEGTPRRRVRQLPASAKEPYTLVEYRDRYAAYKSDPDLQAAHASAPFLMSFDDHEVDNDWAADRDQDGTEPEAFLRRRAAAFQAYYEHMPLRRSSMPRGSAMAMYRRFRFGRLAQINVLDTRQYRTDQPCGGATVSACRDASDPRRTMLGAEQERWLFDGLARSRAAWNVLAQQVLMTQFFVPYLDGWDGAIAARNRLLDFISRRRIPNTIVLTGDIHSHWASELKADFDDIGSETLAFEFAATSISSGGDSPHPLVAGREAEILRRNPYLKFYNGQRGYLSIEVTPEIWQTHFRAVDYVTRGGAPLRTAATFVVENGNRLLQRA